MRKASGSQETGRRFSEYPGITTQLSSSFTATSTIASVCLVLTLWGGVPPASPQPDIKPHQQVWGILLSIVCYINVLQATWTANTSALWTTKHSDLPYNWFLFCWKSALSCAYSSEISSTNNANKIHIPLLCSPWQEPWKYQNRRSFATWNGYQLGGKK